MLASGFFSGGWRIVLLEPKLGGGEGGTDL